MNFQVGHRHYMTNIVPIISGFKQHTLQRANGLQVDGIVGPNTQYWMNNGKR